MFRKFFKTIFSGSDDRKYFAIVLFVLILFFLSAFISPLLIENRKENWNRELSEKINEIKTSVMELFKEEEKNLLSAISVLKNELHKTLSPDNTSYGRLIKLVNENRYSNYSIEIFAPNGRLIAWNNIIAVPQNELFPLDHPVGETYFFNKDLITYLTTVDTFHIENDVFYFSASLPFEKHYELQNTYYHDFGFTKKISEKFYTQFEVEFNPYAPETKDGRKYSFEILNNNENKIGLVTLNKPALDTSIQEFNSNVSKFQALLMVLGFFFLAFACKTDFRKIKYRTIKIILLVIYFGAFRIILYLLNFPANVLEGPLTEPAYFSSAFAGGIVKSPLEFFVTALFILILALTAFRYITGFISSTECERFKSNLIVFLLFLPAAFFFYITIRGLGAAIRSVIFDSTLRYFKVPALIPEYPAIVMNLNVLMLGTAIIFLLVSYILLLLSALPQKKSAQQKRSFLFIYLGFLPAGVIFILIQNQPLVTPFFSILFTTILFILTYYIYFVRFKSIFNYVFISIAASFITISFLNHFNLDLEKEALKTTAYEINRPNENLLQFLVSEALLTASKDQQLINSFNKKNFNFNAAAFKIWSQSSLQKESLNSLVIIYNNSLMPIGSFRIGIDEEINPAHYLTLPENVEPEVKEIHPDKNNIKKYFAGIIPLVNSSGVKGFVTAAVALELNSIISSEIPDFLDSKKNILGSVLDARQLKIFEIENGRLSNVYGDIYPSRDQIKPLLNLNLQPGEEAWRTLHINEENFITYVLNTETSGANKLTAVAFRERELTWNLFNFFKIFFVHSIFIIILFIILFTVNYKQVKYSFRTQIFIGFLIISILPVIVLAIYNRHVFTERSDVSIFNALSERLGYLENHLRLQKEKNPERNLLEAFSNAGKELGISFAVYDGSDMIFNSKGEFYDAGLFNRKLNPLAYYNLNYLSYREFYTNEKIEDYNYDALYKRIAFNGKNLIIEVNNAFNKVKVSFSIVDADVFLFGIYSFAVLIIIVLSTILANKLSAPIRRLTKATDSVAHGDLNVQLINNERGELRDLLDGFNMMTRELKKNEAELTALERENAWKEMAKQVAHEIKNPLTPMKLAVQQLAAAYRDKKENNTQVNKFDEMFEKLSSTILNQIENLSQIASEFSRFAKMPNLNLEKLNLLPVIYDTVNLFVDEKIKIEISTTINIAEVEADYSQLRRMIINFIRNSIQAQSTKIIFNIYEEAEFYSIIIEDNGSGIPEHYRGKIFESNFTTKEKGLGIGLKLAKRFLEGINGSIELVTSSDNGTSFKIKIPKFGSVKGNQASEK